ncbi:Cobalt/zinc/cadmium efflux RND transporter, membrane fusion protein, CzcB family [hydrothermal vent metagenome]|uniref:Cobalt/zinc/cadmium efflux RND transporter, membrane fusion protein, CzcB family n=1 Tax=hydrothermal vent metagenome TaxID=652676 RepID=A0A3B1A985_9ZZZZ
MKRIVVISVFLSFTVLLSACSGDETATSSDATMDSSAADKKERKVSYWVAPMDPSYRRNKPGKSPMGMDLTPVYDDGEDGSVVKINPAVVNNLGVRTALVEQGRLGRLINTVGYVSYDESKLSHVHARTDGWIEKLYVNSEGENVKKGDILYKLYSPTLVNAQEEYLQAMRSGNKILMSASFERLEALGISKAQISQLRRTRKARQTIDIYAPQDGIVARLNVRQGMYIKPATEIMSLADLSSVWLLADVFEKQTAWVKTGNTADVRLSYLPGREWEGEVEYIYPALDSKTRTLKVRLHFDNPGEALKPNMFAKVRIYGGFKDNLTYIPHEALIRTGDEERVILSLGKGRFSSRVVVAGMESGNYVEIQEGLTPGEVVVVSGQFLIDSEASTKASVMRMGEGDADKSKEKSDSMETGKAVMGMGKVKSIMAGHGMLTLEHEPIESLGWPAMTMDFTTVGGVDLSNIKADQAVHFELQKQTDGDYKITAIKPAE